MVARALVRPLHTGGKVVELVRVELVLVFIGDGLQRILPVGPGAGFPVRGKAERMAAAPAHLLRMLRILCVKIPVLDSE